MKTPVTRWWVLLLLAVLTTLLNAFKPLHIDDAAYYGYARQIASSPLDPYGFTLFWWDQPEPANEILAPPLLPYWWSLALRVTDRPVLWKLWLFPFALCLAASLEFLFRRFASRFSLALTALTVLSPAVLPSFNLMLDVPALALALGSLALFIGGLDGGSLRRVALAGLVAGLAMQTKYTALLAPAAMFLYALTRGRLRPWLLAGGVALALFVAWEAFVAWRYGQSHFLYHLRDSSDSLLRRGYLIPLLFSLTGTVAPAVLVLGLTALRVRGAFVLAAGGLTLLGYAGVACVDLRFQAEIAPSAVLFGATPPVEWHFTIAKVIFGVYGMALWVVGGVVAWRLCRLARPGRWHRLWRTRRDDFFLVLWLALEVAGFFALTPFPAVRRVLGLVVVLTLLTGRLAARTCRARPRGRLLGFALAHGILLGLLFAAVDFRAADAQREAVQRAAEWIDQHTPAAERGRVRVWFTGHWGMQFYAERAGMRPVAPGSSLRRRDWLVVPDDPIEKQGVRLDERRLSLAHAFAVDDWVPLETVPFYYVGHVGLEHRRGPYLRIRIFRVTEDFVPSGR